MSKNYEQGSAKVEKSTPDINVIEDFSNNIFRMNFRDCLFDSTISKRFSVKEETEESEGVEWQSYNLLNGGKRVVKIENNWENKMQVSRITFYDNSYKTKKGISVTSFFKDVKPFIDTLKLNNSVDGELVFHDIQFPNMVYVFDVSNNAKLYNGVKRISNIPNNLEISTITVFRKN
ncbi:hypothetical protein GWC95_10380 [Sediminibacterium roseum]|uniref:Uncharacterized protein n=1 Tax=Sediminibacterium roseum TaxID=1978412 RepID=A0ABW9ZVT2_9BACT|nr:hypothetical protein [Sediminibacterium roseum]NCI50329.1 hypothetical protein [Sediminibacterium roseum]